MAANFITVAFLYFFFHHPDSLVCVSEERNLSCGALDYDPVCALYSGDDCDSPTGYCVKTMPNACSACRDTSVVGHIINGECSYMPFQACSIEHSTDSCSAMEVEGTVCGITQSTSTPAASQNPALTKTLYDTGCQACNAGDATFYLGGDAFGQCRAVSTSTICSPADRTAQDCEWSALPACGYYTGGDCTEELCRKTYDSYCFACVDENVLFYQNGDCSELVPIGWEGIPVGGHEGGDDGSDGDVPEEQEEIVEEEVEEEVQEEEQPVEEEEPEEEEPVEEEPPRTSWKKTGKKVSKVVKLSFPEKN